MLKNEFSTDKANEAIIVHMVYEGVGFKIARFKIMTYYNLLSVVYLSILLLPTTLPLLEQNIVGRQCRHSAGPR